MVPQRSKNNLSFGFFFTARKIQISLVIKELWIYKVFDTYFVATSLHLDVRKQYLFLSHLLWSSSEDVVTHVGSATAIHVRITGVSDPRGGGGE